MTTKTPKPAKKKKSVRRLKGGTQPKNEAIKRERAKLVSAMRLEGVPVKDVGRFLGLKERQVLNITKYAEEAGILSEIRERMQKDLLPEAEKVYKEILTKPAKELADRKVLKGHELKLKAAAGLQSGLGVFRKAPPDKMEASKRLDLQGYLDLQAERDKPTTVEIVEGDIVEQQGNPPAIAAPAKKDEDT